MMAIFTRFVSYKGLSPEDAANMTPKLLVVIFLMALLTGLLGFASCGSEVNAPTATPPNSTSDSTSTIGKEPARDTSSTQSEETKQGILVPAPAEDQRDQKARAPEVAVSIPVAPTILDPDPVLAVTNSGTITSATKNGADSPDDRTTQSTEPEAHTAEPKSESDSQWSIVPDTPIQAIADPTPVPQTVAVQPTPGPIQVTESLANTLPIGGQVGNQAPEFQSINNWINSNPLTMQELRGQVVLIDFWTYTCINCIRTLPYVKQWYSDYADMGLVVVGVHSPEFQFEKDTDNVIEAADGFELEYPIAQDNEFGTWYAFSNRYWPAKYLIDQHGVVRYRHFGEGAYIEIEEQIRKLLKETGISLSD